jgi:hypothetical protein
MVAGNIAGRYVVDTSRWWCVLRLWISGSFAVGIIKYALRLYHPVRTLSSWSSKYYLLSPPNVHYSLCPVRLLAGQPYTARGEMRSIYTITFYQLGSLACLRFVVTIMTSLSSKVEFHDWSAWIKSCRSCRIGRFYIFFPSCTPRFSLCRVTSH